MNNNLSTQLPSPPELQPIQTTSAKIWHAASLVLTIGGIVLMSVGGWIFIRLQIEANQPPPARIIRYSAEELEPASTALVVESESSNIEIKPNSQVINTGAETTRLDEPAAPKPAHKQEVIEQKDTAAPEQEIDVPLTNPQTQNAGAIENDPAQESAAAPAPEVPLEPESDLPLSLADNPLPVVDEVGEATFPKTKAVNETGVPATNLPLTRIVAESIDLDSEVIEVGWEAVIQDGMPTNVWRVADYAAGWHKNSALPGQGGNIVLSAHHNIKGEVFRYTVDLEPGDIVTLYDEAQSYDYVVEDKFIVKDKGEPEAVRRENAKWIGPFNEERLTLITCWPYNNNTHRLIVIAKPAGSSTSE
jgi:sortase A